MSKSLPRILCTIGGIAYYLAITRLEVLPSFPTTMREYFGHAMIYSASVTLFLHLLAVAARFSPSKKREEDHYAAALKEIENDKK